MQIGLIFFFVCFLPKLHVFRPFVGTNTSKFGEKMCCVAILEGDVLMNTTHFKCWIQIRIKPLCVHLFVKKGNFALPCKCSKTVRIVSLCFYSTTHPPAGDLQPHWNRAAGANWGSVSSLPELHMQLKMADSDPSFFKWINFPQSHWNQPTHTRDSEGFLLYTWRHDVTSELYSRI